MKFYIIYKQTGKKEEQIAVYGTELMAIDEARLLDSQLLPWESVQVRKLENDEVSVVPHKIFIAERESKKIIEEVKGQKLNDGLETAIGIIEEYEADDKRSGVYVPNWYDAIDENGNSYFYVYGGENDNIK